VGDLSGLLRQVLAGALGVVDVERAGPREESLDVRVRDVECDLRLGRLRLDLDDPGSPGLAVELHAIPPKLADRPPLRGDRRRLLAPEAADPGEEVAGVAR